MGKRSIYKILEAYRSKHRDDTLGFVGFAGLVGLIAGVAFDNTALGVGGATLIGSATIGEAVEYGKAYMEARLDYLKNGKFSRLEDSESKS
jgi:hypothetical protein